MESPSKRSWQPHKPLTANQSLNILPKNKLITSGYLRRNKCWSQVTTKQVHNNAEYTFVFVKEAQVLHRAISSISSLPCVCKCFLFHGCKCWELFTVCSVPKLCQCSKTGQAKWKPYCPRPQAKRLLPQRIGYPHQITTIYYYRVSIYQDHSRNIAEFEHASANFYTQDFPQTQMPNPQAEPTTKGKERHRNQKAEQRR